MIIQETSKWKSNNCDTIQLVVPSELSIQHQEIPSNTYNSYKKSK